MALIVCPYCGKSVSDTVDMCIHCGKSLHVEEKAQKSPKRYEELNFDEQNALLQQFSREYPEYVYPQGREKAARKRKTAFISRMILSPFCLAILIAQILVAVGVANFETEGDNFLIPGILLFIAIITIVCTTIVCVVCTRSANRYMHRFLLFVKLYQTWLSAREIKYKLTLGEKEKKYKKYFNNINPILYMKEV